MAAKESGEGPQDGRATRWEAHREERCQALVMAAIAAIEREGPDVRIEQIARQAGIARPLLYRYFADKAGLQDAVFRQAADLLQGALLPLWSKGQSAPGALIVPTLKGYFRWVAAHPNLSRYCLRHSSSASVDTLRQTIARRIGEIFSGVFGPLGMSPAAAMVLAAGIVGLTEGSAVWWLEQPGAMPVRKLAEQTGGMALAVLRGALAPLGVTLRDDGTLALPTGKSEGSNAKKSAPRKSAQ